MENEINNDELNYKEAYYYLFNQVSHIITWLKFAQGNAEKICVDSLPEDRIQNDPTEMFESLLRNIHNELEQERDE